MAATDIAFFTERLTLKEQELGELKSAFNTYKLKQKVKYDNLKKDVYAFCRTAGQSTEEKDNVALMQIKVAELETELQEAKRNSESLTEELNKRQTQLNDHMILIKNLENRLKELSPSREARDPMAEKPNQLIDMERIQQQMLYKDQRMYELNNIILEKERQILDLQEMCREQGEVADVRKQAMRLVQKKLESKNVKEVATETDPWFPPRQREMERAARGGGVSRSLSPGHAIASRGVGGSSPPPLDPQFDPDTAGRVLEEDDMLPGTSGFKGKNLDEEVTLRKKQRKRVTFDLPPSAATSNVNLPDSEVVYNQLNETIVRLTEENSRLMADLDHKNGSLANAQKLLEESEQEISRLLRDTKNSTLKARAVAHSRIRELEESLAGLNEEHLSQSSRLQTEIETLRSTREWEVEQNGLLRDQLDKLRDKNGKLLAELDSSGILNRDLEEKVHETRKLLEGITDELDEAEELVVFMEDQKESILDDVEKMKEALFAQDEYIKLLETDNVIYEEHIGLLRDSLGASKVDHRSLLRSKAFETKLKALEQEKEQISIKSREEKLKTKALAQKVKVLEEENEKLMERLCEKEMGAADDADMSETCRQLEARLRESDEAMNYERARFEIELQAEKVENKQRLTECEELKFRVNVLESRLVEQRHVGQAGPSEQQQTLLAQQENSQELQALREQLQQQETRNRELVQNINCLETELDAVRGTNFELQDRVKEADELERDYDELIEKHRETCKDLVALKEQMEHLQTEAVDVSVNEKLVERASSAEKEVAKLKMELEGARVTYDENDAVKKELEAIKAELENEKAVGQQKWDDFCRRALEAPSEPGSRKSSMEIQNQQYIIAFEEKIERLEEDLQAMTAKLADAEVEKLELRRQLERVQEVEHVKLDNEEQQAQKLMVENDQLETAFELEKKTEEQLLAKISDLELEASLAGELSVEMGRVIHHMEKQMNNQDIELTKALDKTHSAEMELRLHEMLNEELGTQLDELKAKEKEWAERKEEQERAANQRVEELQNEVEKRTKDLDSQNAQNLLLVQQIQELESRLTASVIEAKEVMEELQEKKEEVAHVQVELQEAQIQEAQRVANSQELVQHQQQPQNYQDYNQWYYSQTNAGVYQEQSQQQVWTNQQSQQFYPAQVPTTEQAPLGHSHQPHSYQHHAQASVQATHQLQPAIASQESPETHHPQAYANPMGHSHQPHAHPGATHSEGMHPPVPHETHSLQQVVQQIPSTAQGQSHSHHACGHSHDQHNHSQQTVVEQSVEQIQNENELLRQCVNETIQLREDMTQDVEKLLQLKNELETAVDSLKGEIWTLNGQLKASILDRENLEDRVIALDVSLAEQKKKVASLDLELSENQELVEKATRQAAESENESNRRLAECLDMESRRVELEQAYGQLTEYYNQLQAAYNLLYAQQQQGVGEVQQSAAAPFDPAVVAAINSILEELALPVVEEDIRSKLNAIQQKIREKIEEVEQLQSAVSDQSRVNRALEERLEAVEEQRETTGGEQLELRNRVTQLEGDLEWKQEEVDSLRRQVDELQHALNTVIVNDGDDSARLATRQADVDSLFRTNAELAHTNVRLQNELEEKEEQDQNETPGAEERQVLVDRVQELEKKLLEWTDSKEEIERLKKIEKMLNTRILSLEDQLLEKEEQLQEMEEQAMEVQSVDPERVQTLEAANQALVLELEELRLERDTLRSNIKKMEKVQQKEKKQAEEEVKVYQEELEEMKTELEGLKQKVVEQEDTVRKEEAQPTQSAWGDWDEKEESSELKEQLEVLKKELVEREREIQNREVLVDEELEALKAELERSQSQQLELRNRVQELESQNNQNQAEDSWGEWENKEDKTKEVESLQREVETLRRNLDSTQQEQEEMKLRNTELEKELIDMAKLREQLQKELESKSEKEDEWGDWDEKKDERNLEQELEEVRKELEILKAKDKESSWNEWEGKKDNEGELEELRIKLDESEQRNAELELELKDVVELEKKVASLEEQLVQSQEKEETWGDWDQKNDKSGEVEELKASLERAAQEKEDLKLRVIDMEEELRNRSDQREATEGRVQEVESLQREIAILRRDLDAKMEEQEDLKMSNLDLEEELKNFSEKEDERQTLEKQVDTLHVEMEALKLKNMDLVEEIKSSEEKKEDNWGEWGEEKTDEVAQLQDLLSSKEDEIERMKIKISELQESQEDFDAVVEEAQKLRDKLEETEKTLDERDGDNELQVEIDILRTELAHLRKKLEESEVDKKSRDTLNLEAENVGKLKMELEATNKERSKMEAVITRVERENEELMGQLEEAGVVERQMNRQVEETQEALMVLQREVQSLREEKSRLEVEISENVKSSEDAWGDDWGEKEDLSQKHKEELEECQNKLVTVTSSLQSVEQTLLITKETAQQRQQELEEKIGALEGELETVQTAALELKEKEQKLAGLEKKLGEMEKQNNLLKESEGRLLESVDEYGALADKNQEEVDRLQTVVNSLEEERHGLQEEVEILRAEIQKLKTVEPEAEEADSSLQQQLSRLRIERDSLKEQLAAMGLKLSEIEKEKNQVKTAYETLKAKIQARRAAAAAGSSNTPSRAPSRASVASIREIREDPVELTYQVPQPVQVQASQTSYSQDIDDRVQEFLEDVKSFIFRLDSISSAGQRNLETAEQSLDRLIMGKKRNSQLVKSDGCEGTQNPEEVRELRSEVVRLEKSVNSKEEMIRELEEMVAMLTEQVKGEDGRMAELWSTFRQEQTKMEGVYMEQLERLQEQTNESNEENDRLKMADEQLQQQLETLQGQLEQSNAVVNRLEEESAQGIIALEAAQTDKDRLQQELVKAHGNLQLSEDQLKLRDDEISSMKEGLATEGRTTSLLEEALTELEVMKVDLQMKERELEEVLCQKKMMETETKEKEAENGEELVRKTEEKDRLAQELRILRDSERKVSEEIVQKAADKEQYLQDELDRLKTELDERNAREERMLGEMAQLVEKQTQFDALADENEKLVEDLLSLKSERDSLTAEVRSLEQQHNASLVENVHLKEDMDSVLSALQTAKVELEEKLMELAEAAVHETSYREQLDVLKVQMDASLAKKADTLAWKEADLESAMEEHRLLKETLATFQAERVPLESTDEELSNLRGENSQIRLDLNDIRQEVDGLRLRTEAAVAEKAEELLRKEAQVESLVEENKRLREAIAQDEQKEDTEREQTNERLHAELDVVKEEMDGLKRQMERAIADKSDELRWKEAELDSLMEENERLTERVEAFETENARIQVLEEDVAAVRGDNERLRQQLEDYKREVETNRQELEEKVRKLLAVSEEKQLLTEDLNSLESELDALTTRMLSMEQEHRKVASETSESSQKLQQTTNREDILEAIRKEVGAKEALLVEASERERGYQKELKEKEDQLTQRLEELTELQEKKLYVGAVNERLSGEVASLTELANSQAGRIQTMEEENQRVIHENVQKTAERGKQDAEESQRLVDTIHKLEQHGERLQSELEDTKVSLEQAMQSDHLAQSRISQLEERLNQIEAQKQELVHNLEETQQSTKSSTESLQAQSNEWKLRFEQAYSDLCQLHPALQQAQTGIDQLMAQNAGLHQQLNSVGVERDQLRQQLESVQNSEVKEEAPAVLQLVDLEAGPQTSPDTRISIEEDGSKEDDSDNESVSFLDSRPLFSNLDGVIEQVTSSHFVRASDPITQPLIRRLRAVWGRRAFRPYLRYCIAAYFVFIHFVLFNCWFHF